MKLKCCDGECAAVNGCMVGGFECPRCGRHYCPVSEGGDEEGNCWECHEEIEAERKAEEEGEEEE